MTSWRSPAALAALIVCLTGWSTGTQANTSVNGVRLGLHPDGVTRIVMDVSNTMTFRISLRQDPYRVVIESDDLAWRPKAGGPARAGSVAGVRYEKGESGRVIVELREPALVQKAFMLGPDEGLGWRFVMDIKTTSAKAFLAMVPPPAVPVPAVSQPALVAAAYQAPEAISPPMAAPVPAGLDGQGARLLVQSAIDDILGSFAGKRLQADQAQAAMAPMVAKYTDMGLESQQILGRYWSRATPGQQQEFQGLFERFLVKMVSGMVGKIPADQRIVIQGVEREDDRFVVRTLASVPGKPATEVRWVVMPGMAGKPVITDVTAAGAAVLATLQADFTSVVRGAASRSIEALFEPLRRKLDGNQVSD